MIELAEEVCISSLKTRKIQPKAKMVSYCKTLADRDAVLNWLKFFAIAFH